MPIWTNKGKLIVDSQRRLLLCRVCPCGSVPVINPGPPGNWFCGDCGIVSPPSLLTLSINNPTVNPWVGFSTTLYLQNAAGNILTYNSDVLPLRFSGDPQVYYFRFQFTIYGLAGTTFDCFARMSIRFHPNPDVIDTGFAWVCAEYNWTNLSPRVNIYSCSSGAVYPYVFPMYPSGSDVTPATICSSAPYYFGPPVPVDMVLNAN